MKSCAQCDKGSVMAGTRSFLRSHYNPTGRVRKYPNLQWVKLPSVAPACLPAVAGAGRQAGRRVKVCVRCMKKLHRA